MGTNAVTRYVAALVAANAGVLFLTAVIVGLTMSQIGCSPESVSAFDAKLGAAVQRVDADVAKACDAIESAVHAGQPIMTLVLDMIALTGAADLALPASEEAAMVAYHQFEDVCAIAKAAAHF